MNVLTRIIINIHRYYRQLQVDIVIVDIVVVDIVIVDIVVVSVGIVVI